jgi:hypothetical protein
MATICAVEPVGGRKDDEHHGGNQVAGRLVERRIEHPDDQRNRDDPRTGHQGGDGEKHARHCVTYLGV